MRLIKEYSQFINELKQNEVYTLFSTFIKKYNIKSFDQLVSSLTFSMRDMNKYVKDNIEDRDPSESRTHFKNRHYSIKDKFIEFLYTNGYISSVRKHRVNNSWLLLFWTKITNPDSYGGYISFHFIPKFYIMNRLGIDMNSLEIEDNEYQKRSVNNIDLEKMRATMEIVEYLSDPSYLESIKKMSNSNF